MEEIPGEPLKPMAKNPKAFKPDMEMSPDEFVRPNVIITLLFSIIVNLYSDVNNRSIFPTDS